MLLNLTLAKFTLTLTFSMEVKGLLKSVFVGVLCYGTASCGGSGTGLSPL